jgi:hypothetical protein
MNTYDVERLKEESIVKKYANRISEAIAMRASLKDQRPWSFLKEKRRGEREGEKA